MVSGQPAQPAPGFVQPWVGVKVRAFQQRLDGAVIVDGHEAVSGLLVPFGMGLAYGDQAASGPVADQTPSPKVT